MSVETKDETIMFEIKPTFPKLTAKVEKWRQEKERALLKTNKKEEIAQLEDTEKRVRDVFGLHKTAHSLKKKYVELKPFSIPLHPMQQPITWSTPKIFSKLHKLS
ncbi:MAG: uncharacterized protein A8A55_1710 [Amphiamblys sp. WSBS2006]|nr:MAG: uncharacterized protein A8A55_1710 [Amphiamblys sp. WSBS2006]